MFLGLWGSYGKNDSVDVQYRLAGRDVRHGAGHHPARPTEPAPSTVMRSPQP